MEIDTQRRVYGGVTHRKVYTRRRVYAEKNIHKG